MSFYNTILKLISSSNKGLAVLVDPDKFNLDYIVQFLNQIPKETTHFFVGGSSVLNGETTTVVKALKQHSKLPVFLFPGDHTQLTTSADAVLYLSLLSGRNPEFLVGQHVKSVAILKDSSLEIIPTAYLLLDGGNISSVARISKTLPLPQDEEEIIVHTAMAGQYMGAKLIYLEAGSGARYPVKTNVIRSVKQAIDIPLIVGGGIRNEEQRTIAYEAGADLIVMGNVFENIDIFESK